MPGTYYLDGVVYQQSGANDITSSEFFGDFHVSIGTRIYVTARLMTGATRVFRDSTFLGTYTNLEQNTKIVTSFVLQ